jgi:putative intracellular protease/amidase
MERRRFLFGVAGLGMLMGTAVYSPDGRGAIADDRRQAMAALRPPKRARPVVAIVADNRGSETTDLMIPQAVLTRSGLADVIVVAPQPGKITLMPALAIDAQQTLEAFDRAYPEGADYVIVPAFHHDESSGPLIDWLKRQASSRAIVVGICEGVKVLGRAGLLDGRRATTHWYSVDHLRSTYPSMQWVRDRRYVIDKSVVTTTGVTASIPVSLALVEAIGGAGDAERLAARIGVADYGVFHDSDRYRLNASRRWRFVVNNAALWRHETIGIPVQDGVDGIALALTADAWTRTCRAQAVVLGSKASITTADGLVLRVDGRTEDHKVDVTIPLTNGMPPAKHLDRALTEIASRYGTSTADLAALQLEYPWP